MATNVLQPPIARRKTRSRPTARRRVAARRGNSPQRLFRAQSLSNQAKQGLTAFLLTGLATALLLGGIYALLLQPVNLASLWPQSANPANQRAYVTRVLENYKRTQNIAQTESDLATVDPQELASALAALRQTTSDPQAQQQLAALSAALQLRPAQPSLTDTLLAEPVFMVGLVLSLVPLLGAIAVVAGPALLRRNRPDTEQGRSKNAEAEADQRSDGVPLPTSGTSPTLATSGEALPELRGAASKADTTEPEGGEKKGALLDKVEDETNAGSSLSDLSSLFEEEETSSTSIETLARSLSEVEVAELSVASADTLQGLKDVNHGDSKRIPQAGAPA
jgi:hypothetical protein